MKIKLMSIMMLCGLTALAQPANPHEPPLNIVDAGYYANSVCGSGHKCWVVHVKNTPSANVKNPAATPSCQTRIDFDYYTGTQDAPQQAYRLTAHGTVPALKAGADAWVRVVPDTPQPAHETSNKVVNASRAVTTQGTSNPTRLGQGSVMAAQTAAQVSVVAGPAIPDNYRGFTASVEKFGAKVFQQGQPFTHELTCDMQTLGTSAIIKNGQIQVKSVMKNQGYQGTCTAVAKFTFVISFAYGYVLPEDHQVFDQTPPQRPETNPSTWGHAINSFHFNCNAFCQQHCAKVDKTTNQRCWYHIGLFDDEGNEKALNFWDDLRLPKD